MANPHVRLFPHSQEEFPSEDLLRIWLLSSLRGLGGVYLLRSASAVKDLPPGSVVLFQYGREKFVGEAIVWKGKKVFQNKLKHKTLLGEKEEEYEAQVTFAPSSIRLYSPPLEVNKIQPHTTKNLSQRPTYIELDWSIYARILEEVVSTDRAFVT